MELVLTHTGGRPPGGEKPGKPAQRRTGKDPGWADGLRRLYDSVLNEPLPDSFQDLLKKLDQEKGD